MTKLVKIPPEKRKTIVLWLLSAILLASYYFLTTSQDVLDFLHKVDRFRNDAGMLMYTWVAILAYAMLLAGIFIPIRLIFKSWKTKK